MDRTLRQDIIAFLTRHIGDTAAERRAQLSNALHGCEVLAHVKNWDTDTKTFTSLLCNTLNDYGSCEGDDESALIVFLRAIGSSEGFDVREKAENLCAKLLKSDTLPAVDISESPTLPAPSPNPRMSDHIFISYSHDDRPFVDRLAEDLRRQGHIMWVDFGGIRGGDVWRQSIADGIHASAVVLVVVTPTALQSEWVDLEVKTAKSAEKLIVPLLIDTLTESDRIDYERLGLESIQFRDFSVGYEDAFSELLADLPQPEAGLPGYCQKMIARLADTPWGLDHYIQEEAKILPIHASPYDEGLQARASENLLAHLWRSKRTIVLGEPGIGKSVALERLAWELASNDPPIVPILINLREYDGLSLLEWIRLKLLESDEEAIRNTLQKTDETERFLHEMPFTFYLLLDGLNEVRPQYREKALQEIRRISLMYPQHPVVVTSRVQDKSWRDLRVGSFDAETLVVQSITMEQAQHYLAAHLSVDDAEDLWRRLDARMQGLATTPLILWLIKEAWLETRGRIPGNRGELYANFIERMLRRDDDRRLNDSVGREARLEALDALALAMHEEEAVAFNHQQVKAIIPNETVLNALLFNGLLQGEDIIRFAPHQTVQEHFAARAIRSQTETELNKSKLGFLRRILSQLEPTIFDTASDPWWAETFIQLAGLTENPNLLARKIAETNPWLAWWCVREGQAVDPETEQVIQAQSALLIDSDDVQDRRNAVQALLKLPRARVIEQLAKLAIDSDSSVADPARRALDELGETGKLAVAQVFEERITRYEPSERAEIGRWLSEWGDMRRGVGINNGIPNIDWVHIPDDGMWTYQNEKRVGLGSYDISRYPVTCAQFQCFVDASDGFYSEEYDWFDGLHESARTFELRDQRFDYSNHPREPVNWYQAMAFCRWLSWKMTFDNFDRMKIETWSVRLPTEFEWEKAARGIDGRVYPYGNNFDSKNGNTREAGINETSAVGAFVEGASPYGVLDMIGNVWEWCLTDYRHPVEYLRDENISANSLRVVRGGSWFDTLYYARNAYRDYDYPFLRDIYVGFRVVRPAWARK